MAYENKFLRYLRNEVLIHQDTLDFPKGSAFFAGQWFECYDTRGRFYCQPDLYIRLRSKILLFEAKLSRCRDAYTQLSQYAHLLTAYYKRPCTSVSVFKNPGQGFDGSTVDSFEDVLVLPAGEIFEWHLYL